MTSANRPQRNHPPFAPPLLPKPITLPGVWQTRSWLVKGLLVTSDSAVATAVLAALLPFLIDWEYPVSALGITCLACGWSTFFYEYRIRAWERRDAQRRRRTPFRFATGVVATLLALVLLCGGAWIWMLAGQASGATLGEPRVGGVLGVLGGSTIAVLSFSLALMHRGADETLSII